MKCASCTRRVKAGDEIKLGRRHGFCSIRCLNVFAADRVLFLESEMNRIYIRTRGRAREIAHNALTGNVPSIGGRG